MKRPRLTKEQARQVRSLIEDGGWPPKEARELVLAGFGEDPSHLDRSDDYERAFTGGVDR